MARARKAEETKFPLIFLFVVLLVFNGIFALLEPYSFYRTGQSLIFARVGDLPFGTRVVTFLIGGGMSWWLARVVYRFLFIREVEVEDALNVSYTLFFYLLLTIMTYSFLGVLAWYWFPLLFVILFVVSMLTLWNFLGGPATVGSFIFAAAVVLAAWFWAHTGNVEALPPSQAESTPQVTPSQE